MNFSFFLNVAELCAFVAVGTQNSSLTSIRHYDIEKHSHVLKNFSTKLNRGQLKKPEGTFFS